MSNQSKHNTVVLYSGLFEDSQTVSAALSLLNIPDSHRYTLTPETMNDRDWDALLALVLSAKRVITL